MRRARSVHRKAKKAHARRKDFLKRKHINANVPTEVEEERVEVYKTLKPHILKNGRANIAHVGYKVKKIKKKVYLHHEIDSRHKPLVDVQQREVGMIQYPISRKYKVNK